jgi:hypothetical protein
VRVPLPLLTFFGGRERCLQALKLAGPKPAGTSPLEQSVGGTAAALSGNQPEPKRRRLGKEAAAPNSKCDSTEQATTVRDDNVVELPPAFTMDVASDSSEGGQ